MDKKSRVKSRIKGENDLIKAINIIENEVRRLDDIAQFYLEKNDGVSLNRVMKKQSHLCEIANMLNHHIMIMVD